MLRVLFIGQGSVDAILAELRRGGHDPTFERVSGAGQLQQSLAGEWDIAIAEFQEGEFGPLQALRIIRDSGADLPLIVVSDQSRHADVPAVLKAGAVDYLAPGKLMRLNAAVEREMRAREARREHARLEEQFRQAQKMEAVGRLAGGVAHDFNNLLTVITGYSDLLLASSGLSEAARSGLEEIRRAAERGGALTGQLLTFSRRQPMRRRTVHVNELVVELEGMLRRTIGEDIRVVTLPAAEPDTVDSDPSRLEQVIMNLAVNARDAMPDGGTLTIETGVSELAGNYPAVQLGLQPGRYVTISITDTGTGMDKQTQEHLFEPFFTTKTPGRGTGLGLATAYGIVRQSGGTISIESEPGRGTVVRVSLPLSDAPVQSAAPPERLAPSTGKETILVVEDEARVRKLIYDLLTSRGYRVLQASGGVEALRICAANQGAIDLAVVDVVMPEMSGPELVKRIAGHCPRVRLLYISGYTDEAILHHRIQESGLPFLQKPFLPESLALKVREALDANAGGAAPPMDA